MTINDAQLWILQTLAVAGSRGISDRALEELAIQPSIALSNEDGYVLADILEEEIDQLEEMQLIDVAHITSIGTGRAIKIRHCTLNQLGNQAIAATLKARRTIAEPRHEPTV